MKNISFLLICFLFGTSCIRQVEPKLERYGYFRAKMNGKIWQSTQARGGSLQAPYDNFMGVSGRIFSKEGYLRETIGFNIPKQLGKHLIHKGQPTSDLVGILYTGFYVTSEDDGDVGCDYYSILEENGDNWVEITHYDPASRIVKGKFQATFIIDATQPKCNPKAPDIIRFTEGIFETKIFE